MLGEEEHPVGPQDPRNFSQCLARVVDGAKNQRRNDDIDAGVLEGESLGGCFHNRRLQRRGTSPLLEPCRHMRVGLGQQHLRDPHRVMRQVEPRPGAQLEYSPGRTAQEVLPHSSKTSPLGKDERGVIHAGEYGSPHGLERLR